MAGAEHAKRGRAGACLSPRRAPARVLRASGPFGRWARSDVLRPELCCRVSARSVLTGRRTRTLRRRNRAARVRDAFRETRECFLPRADGGRAGNRDRLPPSKERDKSVLTVREGNYTARASFQYNTGRFGLERLACSEFPAEARFTSPNQNCYNTEARKLRQHRVLQRVLHELLTGGYSYFRHWENWVVD